LREYELRMDNIQFELDLSEKMEETSADPYQLQQVFINMINNAHNALKEKKGGNLNIKSYNRDDKILVEIEDNGPGIPDENIRKIFDPFFTTKEVGEGTGLGLSIVYGIIKKHGGTIYVDSNLDRGTKFTIELPVVKDFVKEEKAEIERPKKPEGVKSVLVVEDEASLRDYVSEALLLGGYTVETCGGGEEAIKLLRENSDYDAIVSDMKMPGLSGQNLYTFVHKECPKLADRMLFITGDILGKETQNFLKITGAKFVEKPFTIDELLYKLSDILEE
jgi:two-component system NtrC family sensor kinase